MVGALYPLTPFQRMKEPIKNFSLAPYPHGNISQFYGENPALYRANVCHSGECMQGHNGLDIVAPWGTPIYAVEGGIVADAKDTPTGYGKHIRILSEHDLGRKREWTYGHLSRIDVQIGDRVEEGQQIGLMGNTGFVVSGATPYWQHNPYAGTHLHLGLRILIPWMLQGSYSLSYGTHLPEFIFRGNVQAYANGFFGSIDPKPVIKEGLTPVVEAPPLQTVPAPLVLTWIGILNSTIEYLRKAVAAAVTNPGLGYNGGMANHIDNRRFGFLSSSVNPQKLSARVTGAIVASSGVIIFILSYVLKVPNIITPAEIEVFATEMGTLVGLGATAYGVLHSLIGFIRMIVARMSER